MELYLLPKTINAGFIFRNIGSHTQPKIMTICTLKIRVTTTRSFVLIAHEGLGKF